MRHGLHFEGKLPQTCGCAGMLCVHVHYVYVCAGYILYVHAKVCVPQTNLVRATSWPEAAGKAINQPCR